MGSSSRRAALAIGLGFGSLFGLVGRVLGQTPREPELTKPGGEAPVPPQPAGAVGSIDMNAVLKADTRTKTLGDQFKAALAARRSELLALWTKASHESERLAGLEPGSAAHKSCEATVKTLKDQFEEKRKASEEEFAKREAETLSQLIKEIRRVVADLSRERGLGLVVRTPNPPENAADPKQVMAVLEHAIVYTDPRHDLTAEVIARLNGGA